MGSERDAPGLKWKLRKTGQRAAYWAARADLIKAGYRPKNVRLHFDITDPDQMDRLAARCRVLQAEMLEWASGRRDARARYDGTLKSLVDLYQVDPESPYQDLRQATQKNYSKHLRILMARVGERRIDALTGADVRRWYKNIAAPTTPGGPERLNYAYFHVGILKAVVSYGASCGIPECGILRAQMTATRFKQGGARRTQMTYDQVVAFRAAAYADGKPSMALGVTLQFDLALRQRDVIGVWIDDESGTDGIRRGRQVWRDGLTWSHIDQAGILRKVTSKTAAPATHRLADYPDLVAELARVPAEARVGPVVIDERYGLPYTDVRYRQQFRRIATAAGLPATVWNMDARAGAVTEAYEAGADLPGAMAIATHTQVSTSRRYNRDALAQTSRVAKLRVKRRAEQAPNTDGGRPGDADDGGKADQ